MLFSEKTNVCMEYLFHAEIFVSLQPDMESKQSGKMIQNNTSRRAVIMGATSGIGLEVARALVARGWQLGLAGRRTERLQQLRKELPQVVAVRSIDVTQEEAPGQLYDLIEEMQGMDLYFHSSGIGYQNVPLDVEKEMATVATNAVGFTRMVTAAWHYFAARPDRPGHIAVISSIAGTKGLGAAPAYSSTKRFQNHYLECLSQLAHIRKLPVTFTDIRPGFVATDLIRGANYPLQLRADVVARRIVHALDRRKAIVTIDGRYRLLVFFWRLIPRCLWVRLRIPNTNPVPETTVPPKSNSHIRPSRNSG